MIPTLIYCASGNRRFMDIATTYGYASGAQLPSTIYYPPYFVDQNWKKPDRAKYMAALAQHRPYMATVLDWEREDQWGEVLEWATEAAQHVQDTVIIIPKVPGQIDRIPRLIAGKRVRLGYSIPTRYGGTGIVPHEFAGWDVHLLGGSPQKQIEFTRTITGAKVVSADGNYAQGEALKRNQFFAPGGGLKGCLNKSWPRMDEIYPPTADTPYLAFTLSCINMQNAWADRHGVVRYALESDIDAIVKIIRQYPAELGRPFHVSLRERIRQRELFVVLMQGFVAGFVEFHAVTRGETKGMHTIYQIAVDKRWRGLGLGHSLMTAVPFPRNLKCTVANEHGNRFYEQLGMQCVRTEAGKHQPLNVWQTKKIA